MHPMLWLVTLLGAGPTPDVRAVAEADVPKDAAALAVPGKATAIVVTVEACEPCDDFKTRLRALAGKEASIAVRIVDATSDSNPANAWLPDGSVPWAVVFDGQRARRWAGTEPADAESALRAALKPPQPAPAGASPGPVPASAPTRAR